MTRKTYLQKSYEQQLTVAWIFISAFSLFILTCCTAAVVQQLRELRRRRNARKEERRLEQGLGLTGSINKYLLEEVVEGYPSANDGGGQ